MIKKLLLLLLVLQFIPPVVAYSQNINNFNGTWIGEVEILYSTQVPEIKKTKAKIKLVLFKNNAELYTFQTNLNSRGKYLSSWKEFMKDKLVITRHKSNIVISGIDSGTDENGNWEDSLSIQLTRVDRENARINFSKQINNAGSGQMNVFGIGSLRVVNNNNR